MSHRFPERDAQAGGANQPPQKMLLNRKQVHVGESYSIKGDAQLVQEQEEIVRTIAEKKIRKAEAEAQQIIAIAKQEAEGTAKKILQEAAEKADATANKLIADAQAQHDAVLEKARQDGFEAGFTKGYQDAVDNVESETITLLETAQTVVDGAYQAEQIVLARFQEDALELIRHVAEKVIQQELKQPEVLVDMIQSAVDKLYLTGRVKVVLGQTYLEMLRSFTPKTAEMMERVKRFEWTGDPLMSQHEIHILSAEGAYSVGPDDQVAALLLPLENQLPLADPDSLPKPQMQSQVPGVQTELPETRDMAVLEEHVTDSGLTESDIVNSLETDPLVLLEEIVSLIPAPHEITESGIPEAGTTLDANTQDSMGPLDIEALDVLPEANLPVVTPWSLDDLEVVQEEYSEAASEPAPNETLPDAKPVEFPDLESLLTEFGTEIDQEPDEDILS